MKKRVPANIDHHKLGEEPLKIRESDFGLSVNVIPALVWSSNPDGSVHFVNQQWCEYTGLSLEESCGWGWKTAIHPDELGTLAEKWESHGHANAGQASEVRLRRSDGVFRWFSLRREPLRDETGALTRWYGTGTDIDRAKQRETLHAAEKRTLEMVARGASLREVLNQLCNSIDLQVAPSVTTVLVMDDDGKQLWQGGGQRVPPEWISTIIPVPVAFEAGLCGTAAFLKERVIVSDVANEPNWPDQYRDLAIRNGIRAAWSEPILTKDNEVLGTFALYSHEARVPDEEDLALIKGAGHIAHIAIERQRSQEALRNALEQVRKSETKLRQVIDAIPTLAWSAGPDGSADFLNQRWLDYTGLTAEQAQGSGWTAAIHPDDLKELSEHWQSSLATGTPVEVEARMRRFDGASRWFLFRANPVRDESGNIVKWYGTNIDIEDRKRGEEVLRARELSWRQIVDNIPGLVHTTSATGEVEFHNRQTLEYFGKTKEELKDWARIGIVHPDDLPRVIEAWRKSVETGRNYEIEQRNRRADGVYRWFQARGRPVRNAADEITAWYWLLIDIEDRKKAEEESRIAEEALNLARSELAHVARVTTLNTLTASIAHEVNQPLSGIITNANTCLRMLSAEPPNVDGARETARRTIRDGNRAADVITRLRTLYSKKDPQPELMDLNEAAREVMSLSLSELQRNQVIVRYELAESLPAIMADRTQLQQVILNLVRNASDAMSAVEGRPRELLMTTERDEDDRVCLSVKDAGVGFTPQAADKLFEAFYTTKNDGMGIGLSISRSIIEAHHGRLWAMGNDGPGATFSFAIPSRVEGLADAETRINRTERATDAA